MVKIKILFGVAIAVFIAGAWSLGYMMLRQPDTDAIGPSPASAEAPQVLGASTVQIRGAALPPVSKPVLGAGFDDSRISAKSYVVYDEATGAVLASRNADQRLPIASLTKLMTGLVAYRELSMSDEVTVLGGLTGTSPILGLRTGDQVRTEDVMKAMLVGSCNDAAQALAKFIESKASTTFVSLMNDEASRLGMANTRFSNPTGFDSQYNYSSANDLAKLIQTTQKLLPFREVGKLSRYELQGATGISYATQATNKLIRHHADITAIKTGFTEGSGGSMAVKSTQGGHTVILIVVGSSDRERDILDLKDEIFGHIEWK